MNENTSGPFTEIQTIASVAEVLKVTPQLVWNEIRRGRLRSVKVGRSVRILPEDINAYLAGRRSA